jgi:hypothetical protein
LCGFGLRIIACGVGLGQNAVHLITFPTGAA